ncbi:MAG TPA: ribose-phosphate pyrophosphokinase-like domain-containing protein [Oculatellaceae cyanobacterium]
MQRLLFVTAGGVSEVAARLLAEAGTASGKCFSEPFPDGEIYHNLVTPVGNSEAIVSGTGDFHQADALMELFDVANLVADEGALELSIITSESPRTTTRDHERFLSRCRRRLLSAIPPTPLGNNWGKVDSASPGSPPVVRPITASVAMPGARVATAGGGKKAFVSRKHSLVAAIKSRGKPVVFSTRSYGYMQEQFHALADFERGNVVRDSDGLVKGLDRLVSGRDVVIIGGTIDHAETFDLFLLANAAFEAGALSLTLVVPYFGYSTMERGKPDLHEAVKASYRARLISAIPRCPMGNRVVLCDLHSEGIPHYFDNTVRTTHLYCIKTFILEMVEGVVNGRICTTDTGRGKWAESIVKEINARLKALGIEDLEKLFQAAIAIKDRKSGSKTELLGILGDVAGLDIDLFDDMIRRGTTAIDAGFGYRAGTDNKPGTGCKRIRFIASHAVLPGNSLERLQLAVDHNGERLFSEVIVLDSHPNAVKLQGDFLKVKSIAHLLVAHVIQSLAIGS